jgi:hypothetical protein
MIVYLLVHLPSEMSYVGSTETSADVRFMAHWKKRNKDTSEIAMAMRASVKSEWMVVTLDAYESFEDMLDGERDWILALDTLRPGVGYNSQVPRKGDVESRKRLIASGRVAAACGKEDAATARTIDYYRACGEKGALKRSHEQQSADGKRGALKRWEGVTIEDKVKLRNEASARQKRWWASLTPEQQETHRQKGREGGRESVSKKVKVS